MDALLLDATMVLAGNAHLHLFQAILARGVRHNAHLERMHLRAASANADDNALDIQFRVAQRLAQLKEDELRKTRGKMTVELRLHFEAMLAAADAKVQRCWSLILSFWQTLSERHPDYGAMRAIGKQTRAAIQDAEAIFKDLLAMAPTSISVLRSYAAFCFEVSNNPSLAQDMLSDADNLEEEATKALSTATDTEVVFGAASEIDMTADDVALLRISARASEVGVGAILYANTIALKIFGYSDSKREVLGRDMSMIVPEPISSVHQNFLTQFYHDGVQIITGSSKYLFGVHKSGHIFPIRAHVYSSGEVWAAAMEEVLHVSSFFLFVYATQGHPVTAACRGSLTHFQFTITAMRSGTVSLGTYFHDPAGLLKSVAGSGHAGRIAVMKAGVGVDPGATTAAAAANLPPRTALLLKAQQLNVSHLLAPVFIIRMRHCSAADVASAAASGQLLGLLPGEAPPLPSQLIGSSIGGGGGAALPIRGGASGANFKAGGGGEKEWSRGRDSSSSSSVRGMDEEEGGGASVDSMSVAGEEEGEGEGGEDLGQGRDGNTTPTDLLFPNNEEEGGSRSPSRGSPPGSVPGGSFRGGWERKRRKGGGGLTTTTSSSKSPGPPKGVTFFSAASTSATGGNTTSEEGGLGAAVSGGAGGGDNHHPKPPLSPPSPSLRQQHQGGEGVKILRQRSTATAGAASALTAPSSHHSWRGSVRGGGGGGGGDEDNNGKPAQDLSSMPRHWGEGGGGGGKGGGGRGGPTGGGSVVSGGSGVSRLSRLSAAEIVRRGVAFRLGRLETSLLRLRNRVVSTFAIAALISILSYVVINLSFNSLMGNLQSVADCAERMVAVEAGYEQVQLEVAGGGAASPAFTPATFESSVGGVWSKERLRVTTDAAEALHQALYLAAEGAGGGWRDFYLEPKWVVQDLVVGTYGATRDTWAATPRNISFSNLMLEYIAKTRTFWWLPVEATSPKDPGTWWLESNGPGVLLEALNASMFQAFSASASTASTVTLSNLVVMLVALFVFILVALIAILPAIFAVMREQHEVYDVLVEVPLRVVRQLRDVAADKVVTMKHVEEGGDAPMDVGGLLGAEGEGGVTSPSELNTTTTPGASSSAFPPSMSASEAALAASAASMAQEEAAAHTSKEHASGCCRRTPRVSPQHQHHHHHHHGPRTYRNAASGIPLLTLRLLWPVLFFCLYFVLTFWWRSTVNSTSAYFRSEVVWGAEMRVLVPTLAHSLRNALIYPGGNVSWVPTWVNKSASQLGLLSVLVDALSYGSADLNLRPALTSSPSSYAILMSNGCVPNAVPAKVCANYGGKPCNYYYEYSNCREPSNNVDPTLPVFFYALVGKGLLPALKQYLLLAGGLVSDRVAALAASASASTPLPQVPLTLPGSPLNNVDLLGRVYLPAGLQAMATARLGEHAAYLASFSSLNLAATILSVLFMVAFYLLIYRPLFFSLDEDIKSARSLLLLLPEDAARAAPAFLELGKRLLVNQ